MSKGSRPRPFSISQETYSNNFDAIFKKKKKDFDKEFFQQAVMKEEYYDLDMKTKQDQEKSNKL